MKNLAKLCILGIFALFSFGWFVNGLISTPRFRIHAQAQPTPPANTPVTNANTPVTNAVSNSNTTAPANTAPAATPATTAGKSIPKNFTLGQDSVSEYGEAAFDHDTHAIGLYSPDGKSVVGCVECHHTDQPKSALKPPLVTSERDVVLTMETWRASSQKVSTCRSCHFQDGSVPDGKTMPTAAGKDLTNELAYHINCNTCHDAAFKLRPDLKKKAGFATTNDCLICHKKN